MVLLLSVRATPVLLYHCGTNYPRIDLRVRATTRVMSVSIHAAKMILPDVLTDIHIGSDAQYQRGDVGGWLCACGDPARRESRARNGSERVHSHQRQQRWRRRTVRVVRRHNLQSPMFRIELPGKLKYL